VNTVGGAGGGAIKITTTGILTVSGTISANGAVGTTVASGYSGGGSGGSVLVVAGSVSGGGSITANGGDSFGNAGGGGGGRIAIYYSLANNFSGSATATVGATGSGGGNGTVNGPVNAFSSPPDPPTALGGNTLLDGSFSTNTQPTLNLTLSDPDSSQTVQFRIQISSASDYSALVVDYTSALAAQGATSFTVGQAAGSGSYSVGSASQTLSDGNYYWRVKALNSLGASSDYVNASYCVFNNTCDLSGSDNALTLNDNATVATAKFGKGLSLDGTNDRANFNTTTNIPTGQNQITIAAWVNATTLGATWRNIIARNDSPQSFAIYNTSGSPGKLSFTADGGTNTGISVTTLSTGNWYHVAMVTDGTKTKLYINGSLDAQTNFSGTIPSTGGIAIGADPSGTNAWAGKIDDVRIYNRTFSSSDIQILYNWGPNPSGYWNFDEAVGGTAYDSSGNSNNGTDKGTTIVQGKFGRGRNFNGTSDNIIVSHVIPGVQTVGFWIKPTTTTTSVLRLTNSIYISASAGTLSATGFSSPIIYVNSIVTSTITANVWQHVEVTTATAITATSIKFGFANSSYFSGIMDDVRIYPYVRSVKQIVSDMNAGHPNVGSPVGSAVAWWKFDEGVDNTCSGGTNDVCNFGSAGSTLDGAESNMSIPATSTSGWTSSGKFNKGLIFDGSNDFVSLPNSAAFSPGSGDITVSAWVKPSSVNSAQHWIFSDYGSDTNNLYTLFITASNKFEFLIRDGSGNTATADSTTTPNTGQWYHLVGTRSGTTSYIYVNGILQGSGTNASLGTVTTLDGSVPAIGIYSQDQVVSPFAGTIDEMKIYNYNLTADEVKVDYNRGVNLQMGVEDIGQNLSDGAGSAPIFYWDLNEKTGTTTFDKGGGGITGTFTSATTWVPGKFGYALNFNGSDTRDTGSAMVSTATSNITMEAWLYPTTQGVSSISIPFYNGNSGANGYGITLSNGACGAGLQINIVAGGLSCNATGTSTTISLNKWTHVAIALSGSSSWSLYINGSLDSTGSRTVGTPGTSSYIGGGEYYGKVDEAKFYNYARTAAQVAFDYNRGAPMAWWKFDECQGSTLYDYSPNANDGYNGNNGTITPNTGRSTGSCSSGVSTEMWNGGTTGKYNSSLAFDGAGDYVDLGDIFDFNRADQRTFCAWVYYTSSVNEASILNKSNWNPDYDGWTFHISTNRTINFQYVNVWPEASVAKSLESIDANTWQHVCAVWNNTAITLYKNGRALRKDDANSWNTIANDVNNTHHLNIGGRDSGLGWFFPGQIDDVRIYNYALSGTQIKQVYNDGSVVRFGPVTGSP
ncbi:MAG TPA: LamG domain-containing protein, partial [Candidatus Saccharimonadales bacterium]|nr:LamG domain-containing protein [Candidatus Saccharimonadales bacterium]